MATALQTTRARVSPAVGRLILLIGLNVLNSVDRSILPGAQAFIQKEHGWNGERIGALTTALFVIYMLVALITRRLGDRFSGKPLIRLVKEGHDGEFACILPVFAADSPFR